MEGRLTFSSCWKELGCWDLSILNGWDETDDFTGLMKRKERGETSVVCKGRPAESLSRSML